jgi:hypothetical protein
MKVNVTIPTKLSEITLSQYQKYLDILKDNQDTNFMLQKTVQIFCNVKLSDVANMRYKDVIDIVGKIENAFKEQTNLIPTFTHNGTKFGFIPKLEDMSFDEYSNLDSYLADWNNIHRAMAILYRPIVKEFKNTYEIAPYSGTTDYAEVMKSMPLDVVLGANVFFWNLSNDLLTASLSYLEKTVADLIQTPNLVAGGVGTPAFMQLREEVSSILKQLQK